MGGESQIAAAATFETTDLEVVARLRETYRPTVVRIVKSGATYRIEDPERRGKQIAIAVQAERQEVRKQGVDPDPYFAKKRQEHAEALGAR
jgi:hypothetical protein